MLSALQRKFLYLQMMQLNEQKPSSEKLMMASARYFFVRRNA
jgi:hypothetical protein